MEIPAIWFLSIYIEISGIFGSWFTSRVVVTSSLPTDVGELVPIKIRRIEICQVLVLDSRWSLELTRCVMLLDLDTLASSLTNQRLAGSNWQAFTRTDGNFVTSSLPTDVGELVLDSLRSLELTRTSSHRVSSFLLKFGESRCVTFWFSIPVGHSNWRVLNWNYMGEKVRC
jgi:hypothetical protein